MSVALAQLLELANASVSAIIDGRSLFWPFRYQKHNNQPLDFIMVLSISVGGEPDDDAFASADRYGINVNSSVTTWPGSMGKTIIT